MLELGLFVVRRAWWLSGNMQGLFVYEKGVGISTNLINFDLRMVPVYHPNVEVCSSVPMQSTQSGIVSIIFLLAGVPIVVIKLLSLKNQLWKDERKSHTFSHNITPTQAGTLYEKDRKGRKLPCTGKKGVNLFYGTAQDIFV